MNLKTIKNLPTKELQTLFQQAFGQHTPSRNRPWLIKRLLAAPAQAAEVPSSDAVSPPPTASTGAAESPTAAQGPSLIPPPGSQIRKTWRGRELVVSVQTDGFRLDGTTYPSLSAAATALCGGNRNGLVFFGLKPRPVKKAPVSTEASS